MKNPVSGKPRVISKPVALELYNASFPEERSTSIDRGDARTIND
ncbi:hypothetical protein QT995_20305 [Microcoleus sp. S36b_A3]